MDSRPWRTRGYFRDGIWHSRGYLVHCDKPTLCQFVTIRLVDSLPREVLGRLKGEIAASSYSMSKLERYRRIEAYVDAGYGSCLLREPRAAQIVEDTLLFHAGSHYELESWCVMPNHLHMLIEPIGERRLADIVRELKTFSAHAINKALRRTGAVWYRDYFDRYIRTPQHFDAVLHYIENNPVKAGLCLAPEMWPYSSARRRRDR